MGEKALAITVGEPAGVGPDLVVCWLKHLSPRTAMHYRIFAPKSLILSRAEMLGVALDKLLPSLPVQFTDIPLPALVTPGELNPAHADFVIATLQEATQACLSGQCQGLITAPIHKAHLNAAGIPFTGHTGFLEDATGAKGTLMLFVAETLKVALATTHVPLVDVPHVLTQDKLQQSIELLQAGLRHWFGIASPHIGILALNPHAGEEGYLGQEEIYLHRPVITRLREQGFHLSDPLPADTAFNPLISKQYDALLAMYHDQGLAPVKMLGFGQAVNVTLGLPFIRTSVDHGTALAIAGTPAVDASGFERAVLLAEMLSNR